MSKDFKELGVGVGKDLDCDLMVGCRRRYGPGEDGVNVMRVGREPGVKWRSLTNISMESISRAGHHGKALTFLGRSPRVHEVDPFVFFFPCNLFSC